MVGVLLATGVEAAIERVGVSILPLEPLVQEIAGAGIEVRSLQQEGDSCSVFEPRPSTINWLSTADVFFRVGVGYESVIMEKIARQFPEMKVEDLREAVTLLTYAGTEAATGAEAAVCPHCGGHHGEETAHSHGGDEADPHIWVDPVRLANMALFVGERLSAAAPEGSEGFRARAASVSARILAEHAKLEALLAPYAGRGFYIYHPALNYFADRYHLHQVAIAAANQEPTPRELHRLIAQAREERVSTIFIQPQESRKHAEIIAGAVGARLVEIDPMALDWEANLLRMGEALAQAFAND